MQDVLDRFCRHFFIFVDAPRTPNRNRRRRSVGAPAASRRRSPSPYYIPYFQVGTGGRKPTRKIFRNRAVLFGKLAATVAFRRSLKEKTIQKIKRQPI
jgi:hypothetical protein